MRQEESFAAEEGGFYINHNLAPAYIAYIESFSRKEAIDVRRTLCKPRFAAVAQICGSELAPDLRGRVCFFDVPGGTWVEAEVCGLPAYNATGADGQPVGPHGFHLHEGDSCGQGNLPEPFAAAGGHWNPDNQPHGNHAGDFPVLFSNHGAAIMHFFTDRFTVEQVIGKTVVIHQSPDDYRSQPAGNSGKRLGCGVIRPCCGCRK